MERCDEGVQNTRWRQDRNDEGRANASSEDRGTRSTVFERRRPAAANDGGEMIEADHMWSRCGAALAA